MISRISISRKLCRILRKNRILANAVPAIAVLLLATAASAQEPRTKPKIDPKIAEQGKDLFKPGPSKQAEGERFWSVLIVAYPDDLDLTAANQALTRIREETGLTDAYAERRGKNSVVCIGKYDSPADPEAQRDLQRVRAIEWNGTKPFARALLSPPAFSGEPGSIPDLDLRLVRQKQGKKKILYTLEVAEYGRPDRAVPTDKELREFRESAERASVVLRREGNEAYYYHLPQVSVVTVGIFNEDDYVTSRQTKDGSVVTIRPKESPRLSEVRKKFPVKLLNGQGIRVKKKDVAPSVVEVPNDN
jgi:hypothetical protein